GVMHAVALAPAPDRLAAHAVLASQFVLTGRGLLDGRAHGRRGGGVLAQGDQHATPPRTDDPAITARSTSRPSSRPRRLCSNQSSGTRQVVQPLFFWFIAVYRE